jgi:starch synthase
VATSEITPFAKTSPIADLLSEEVLGMIELGHDVRVVIPKYGHVSERRNRIHEIKRLIGIPINVAGEDTPATVKSSQIINSRAKSQVYVITGEKYLDPYKGIYNDEVTGKPFQNNDERFIYFQKAILETCFQLGWKPDIIHCHGWQTALVPLLMKELYNDKNFFSHTKTVFTFSSLEDQGVFPISSFDKIGLAKKYLSSLEHNGKLNFMKAGLLHSDMITTVTTGNAKRVLEPKQANGLEDILKKRKSKLSGICYGVDSEKWNPKTDKLLLDKFTVDDREGKFENRSWLLEKVGFDDNTDIPILSIVGSMSETSGHKLFFDALKDFGSMNLQVIIADKGSDKKFFGNLQKEVKKYKNIRTYSECNNETEHLIYGGSDIMLFTDLSNLSHVEHLIAMDYGTVPIVPNHSAYSDMFVEYDRKKNVGNGFGYDYKLKNMLVAINKAVDLYEDEVAWDELQVRIMKEDHSWKAIGQIYIDTVYRVKE